MKRKCSISLIAYFLIRMHNKEKNTEKLMNFLKLAEIFSDLSYRALHVKKTFINIQDINVTEDIKALLCKL